MPKRSLSVTIAALLFLGTALLQAYDTPVEEVINNPTVTCTKTFSVDATVETWNRVMDNSFLMGRLWEIYGFQPSYKVTGTGAGFHVSDPSGINGDIRQTGRSVQSRTFYGTGSFDHWAVPSFFTADGVAIFEYGPDGDGVSGEVNILLRGNNGISRFVMKLFSGTITRRIDGRAESNLENMKEIIRDILTDPRKVRGALTGQLLSDFDRVFPVTEIKPAAGSAQP